MFISGEEKKIDAYFCGPPRQTPGCTKEAMTSQNSLLIHFAIDNIHSYDSWIVRVGVLSPCCCYHCFPGVAEIVKE